MADNLTHKKQSFHRIPQIELLRAVSLGGIFTFHLWSVIPSIEQSGPVGEFLGRASSFGYLGVVLFNFISGFVLALPYLGSESRAMPSYTHFLRRRLRRIVPKYYLALTLWAGALLITGRDGTLPRDYAAHLAFVHSLFPSTFFSIVPAFWWLGLLAQFYLLFPLILRLFKAMGSSRASLAVCFLCWAFWLALDSLSHEGGSWAMINYMAYYNLPARLPEFALGMWLADAWKLEAARGEEPGAGWTNGISPAYLAFVGAALLLAVTGSTLASFEKLPLKHIWLVSWCLTGTVAVLLQKATLKMGQNAFVTKLAAASYSIYLFHQPMLGYSDRFLQDFLPPLAEYALLLIGIGAASFALAAVVDRYVP